MRAKLYSKLFRHTWARTRFPRKFADNREGFTPASSATSQPSPLEDSRNFVTFSLSRTSLPATKLTHLQEARSLACTSRCMPMNFKLTAGRTGNRMDATSADHLGAITDADAARNRRLRRGGHIVTGDAVLLGEHRYAPARRLIDNGAIVALATDFNPGTSRR
jgi:imidazolonepropionase